VNHGVEPSALADHGGDVYAEPDTVDDTLEVVHVDVSATETVLIPVGEKCAAETLARPDRVDDIDLRHGGDRRSGRRSRS
jgi:hypothetical protein